MKKHIGNVGVLDIRDASEESLANIGRVSNVGVVIFSRKTAHLVSQLNGRNIGCSVELPEGDFAQYTGKITVSGQDGAAAYAQKNLLLIGKITFAPDVSVEMVQGMGHLVVTGKIICPSNLEAALRSRILSLTGKIVSYPASHRLQESDVVFDLHRLQSLTDGSSLACMGDVTFVKGVDPALVERKISSLYAAREITCPITLAETVSRRLHTSSCMDMNVVPDEFEIIGDDDMLTNALLTGLPPQKILWDGNLVIDTDVSPDLWNQKVLGLMVTGHIICPQALQAPVQRVLTGTQTKVYTFADGAKVRVNSGATGLGASYFKFQKSPIVLINTGVLNCDATLSGETIYDHVVQVYNTGVINGNDDQMGAFEARLILNSGVINGGGGGDDEDASDEPSIGNTGYLKL